LNAVHKRTLITFHGPVGGSTFEPWTLENFRRVVMTAEPAGLLPRRRNVRTNSSTAPTAS
jgi:hypothetical protein